MDNYNINTTQGQANEAQGLDENNPAMTYVDFANQIARNSSTQALQNTAVQDAALRLQQAQAANAEGVNPNLGNYLPVDEAVAELKAAGVDDDIIKQFVSDLNGAQVVSRQSLDTIIRKKQLGVRQSGVGKDYKKTDNITLPPGMTADQMGLIPDPTLNGVGHVPADGQYQVTEDPLTGQPVYFIPEGETPPPTTPGNTGEQDAKSWQKLDSEINKFIRSSRGNTLSQAVQRANRALNELGEGQPLTTQVLSFIQKDLSGIFQGGMPPVSGMDSEDFTTMLQRVNQFIAKYTGVQGYLHSDLGNQRDYLVGILSRLRDSTIAMLKAAISSEAEGYKEIIDKSPDQWQQMINDKLNAVTTGLSENAQSTLTAHSQGASGNLPPAMTPAPNTLPAAPGTNTAPRKPLGSIFTPGQ